MLCCREEKTSSVPLDQEIVMVAMSWQPVCTMSRFWCTSKHTNAMADSMKSADSFMRQV